MKGERRQELKHHDEFADTLAWLWESIKLRQREILTGAVAALVLVGAVMYIAGRWQRSRDAAWSTLAAVDDSVAQGRFAMDAKAPDARPAAIEKYKKLAADHPRSGAAPLALFRAAKLLQEAGKLDEARQTLDEVLNSYPKSDAAPAAEQAKAGVLEDQKKFPEAKALYEKIAEAGPKYLRAKAFLGAARCAQLSKDAAQAKALYQKVIAAAPGSEWAQLAEERIKGLGRP